MKYTNINISNTTDSFKYIVSCEDLDDEMSLSGNLEYYISNPDSVTTAAVNMFYGTNEYRNSVNIIRNENNWSPYKDIQETLVSDYIPSTYRLTKIKLYFPTFSVDTYKSGVNYALDIYIKLSHKRINIGSYIINRNNAKACDKVQRFLNNEYYEYYEVIIPNVKDIIYDTSWEDFRKCVCLKEFNDLKWMDKYIWTSWWLWNEYVYNGELNNDIPCIGFSLNPIYKYEDCYYKIDGYSGGQSFINMMETNDYFGVSLSHTLLDSSETYELKCTPIFNSVYYNIFLYLADTYFISIPYKLKIQISIQTNDDVLKLADHDILFTDFNPDSKWVFDIFNEGLNFNSWTEWTSGMYIQANLGVYLNETDTEESLYVKSNKIPIIPELFGYMVSKNINISTKDMNVTETNLNVVNKISKNIIQVDSVSSNKSHFVKPIFFKSQSIANIVIHPDVTETICLNLDQYKSKVDSFIIQIENTIFLEIGQTNSGILFKIVGSKLPKKLESGTYYILNEDQEMITSGKYTYEY